MKVCPACRQYCADQKAVCPKCGGSLESASDYHRAHPEQYTEAIDRHSTALVDVLSLDGRRAEAALVLLGLLA